MTPYELIIAEYTRVVVFQNSLSMMLLIGACLKKEQRVVSPVQPDFQENYSTIGFGRTNFQSIP